MGQALRDRDFKLDRPAAEKWRGWIYKLIKQTNFAKEPEYEAKWMKVINTTTKTNYIKSKNNTTNKALKQIVRVPNQKLKLMQRNGIVNDDDNRVLRSVSVQSNRSSKTNDNNTNSTNNGGYLEKSESLISLCIATSQSGSASGSRIRTGNNAVRERTALDEAIYLEKRNRALLLLQQVDNAEHKRLPVLSAPINQSSSPIKAKAM